MGNPERVCWTVVEFACRILGISTATVLCAVGAQTLQQGEFHSLAIYLLASSVGVMLFELAYFLDALQLMCLPCPPDWWLFVLWGKMARLGGFQKFLYYAIMSLVCFLHPVLVWHAVIPGSMLLVTAFFNFILSKKTKAESPKGPQENYSDQGLTTVCVSERGNSGSTFSFFHMVTGRRGAGLALASRERCFGLGERGESIQAMLDLEPAAAPKERERASGIYKETRKVCFTDRGVRLERETEESERYCDPEPETTSDTAPMITD
ncbi:transmembrane protein 72 isoform 2-T2 [Polymixia lowei]